MAKSVFGDTINYANTEIFADADRPHINPFTTNIHMGAVAKDDVSKESLSARADFIHEMTHVRQAQTLVGKLSLAIQAGAGHAWASIKGFFIGLFTSDTRANATYVQDHKLYEFEGEKTQSLGKYGKEQQAQIVQKNYERDENMCTAKGQVPDGEMNKAKEIMNASKNFPQSLD